MDTRIKEEGESEFCPYPTKVEDEYILPDVHEGEMSAGEVSVKPDNNEFSSNAENNICRNRPTAYIGSVSSGYVPFAGQDFQCHSCGFVAFTKLMLKKHISTKHITKVELHSCPHCSHCATSKYLLKSHILSRHKEDDDKSCPFCNYSTSRRWQLHRHIRHNHTNDKPYACEFCDYSAGTKQYLVQHMLIYRKEKIFRCTLCEFSSLRKTNLKFHIMSRHTKERPNTCSWCEFSSTRKWNLTKHIKRKHSNKEKTQPDRLPKCFFPLSFTSLDRIRQSPKDVI